MSVRTVPAGGGAVSSSSVWDTSWRKACHFQKPIPPAGKRELEEECICGTCRAFPATA